MVYREEPPVGSTAPLADADLDPVQLPARSAAFWKLFEMAFGDGPINPNDAGLRLMAFAERLTADELKRLLAGFEGLYDKEIGRVALFAHKRSDTIRRYLDRLKSKPDTPPIDDYFLLLSAYVASDGNEEERKSVRRIWNDVRSHPRHGKTARPTPQVDRDASGPATKAASIPVEMQRYLTTLKSRLNRIELPPGWGASDLSLVDVFVPPPIDLISRAKSFDTAGATSPRGSLDSKPELGEKVASAQRITLIGAVGTGKGVILRGIALGYIARSLGHDDAWEFWSQRFGLLEIDYIPLFIDLRDVPAAPPPADSDWGALIGEALKPMATMLGPDHAALASVLAERVRQQMPLLILLDGLDERPAEVSRGFLRLIDQMRTDSGNVAVIFSARWRPEQAMDANLRADIFEVGRLTPDMAEKLISGYLAAAGVEASDIVAKAALGRFAASHVWRDVIGNPHSLLLFTPGLWTHGPISATATVDPAGQMLRALLRRREATRGLADQACWEWPIGHVALHMLSHGLQQIDSLALSEQIQRAYDHIRARHPHCGLLHSPDYSCDCYAKAMLECGLLRLRIDSGPPSAGHPSQYDFFSDQVRDWLAASAIAGGWSPESGREMNNFIHDKSGNVRSDRRDQLLELIAVSTPEVAIARLDELMRLDSDANLAAVLLAMARGRAPSSHHDNILIDRIAARTGSNSIEIDRELLLALAAEFGAPHLKPTAWAIIAGLWLNLSGTRRSDFSVIVQRGWLDVEAYVEGIRARVGGTDGADACAAMFEVLEFAFSVSPYALNEKQNAALESVVRAIAANLVAGGVRAAFAAWALSWVYRARDDFQPWLEQEIADRAHLLDLLGGDATVQIGRMAAGHLLIRKMRLHRDLANEWAATLDAGKPFGTSIGTVARPHDADVRAAVERALRQAKSESARAGLAVLALEAGSEDPAIISDALKATIEPPSAFFVTRIVRALSGLPDELRAPALARLAAQRPNSGPSVEALLGLLATCSRKSVEAIWEDMSYGFDENQLAMIENLLFGDELPDDQT